VAERRDGRGDDPRIREVVRVADVRRDVVDPQEERLRARPDERERALGDLVPFAFSV
jgi:hypothetical protein